MILTDSVIPTGDMEACSKPEVYLHMFPLKRPLDRCCQRRNTKADVMEDWQMMAQPHVRAHTHTDTHVTHTHKACFPFYKTEHYCKVDLFTIITASTQLASVSFCSCVGCPDSLADSHTHVLRAFFFLLP